MNKQSRMKLIIVGLRNKFENIDKNVIKLINIGINIAYIICLIGTITLYIEYKKNISLELFYIGLSVFKLGIIIALGFLIIGGGMGIIKNLNEN